MNFAHFCEFWCFSLGKQARFTLNFCSGMPLQKIHELTFLWFGLPGPLLILQKHANKPESYQIQSQRWFEEFLGLASPQVACIVFC